MERVRGWRDELAERRLNIPEPIIGDWTARSGYLIGREIEVGPGTAVFASNDLMAMGLMAALRERGLSVPGDVSLVGFDDVPEAAYLYSPLTTVRQDFAALGEMMMQKVLLPLRRTSRQSPTHPCRRGSWCASAHVIGSGHTRRTPRTVSP